MSPFCEYHWNNKGYFTPIYHYLMVCFVKIDPRIYRSNINSLTLPLTVSCLSFQCMHDYCCPVTYRCDVCNLGVFLLVGCDVCNLRVTCDTYTHTLTCTLSLSSMYSTSPDRCMYKAAIASNSSYIYRHHSYIAVSIPQAYTIYI